MNARQIDYLRGAAAFVALSGLLLCAPVAARGDDTVEVQAPAHKIMLPMLRAGGIPQGQVMQITEHGSELVPAAKLMLAAASAPANPAARPVTELKSASGLFCAGTM